MGRPANKIVKLTNKQRDTVEANVGLVYRVVKQCRLPHLPMEDQDQVGTLALAKSVQKHNKNGAAKLSTYATQAIRNEIVEAEMNDRLIHIPVYLFSRKAANHPLQRNVETACRQVSIDDVSHESPLHPTVPPAHETRLESDATAAVRRAMKNLPTLERDIIRGIAIRGDSELALARKHKVAPQTIAKLKNSAITKLRTKLAKYA